MFMDLKYSYLLLFCLPFLGCLSSKNQPESGDTLVAEALLPYGRTAITDHKLELISSGVHFGFSFEGSTCQLFASVPEWLDHNYLQYELDGVYQKRIKVSRNADGPIELDAGNDGKHTIWIYKATEATTGAIYIDKVIAKNSKALPNPKAPLIEFIGNSITCGAAADASEVPCGMGAYHDQHNAYYSYGPRTARKLGVNFLLSSVSGIGIYRSWNTDEPSMPGVYSKTDFQMQGTRMWDFSLYTPAIVSIALGTNDLSDGDGRSFRAPFDSLVFVNRYIGFIGFVKSKYPLAQIALLNSPIVAGNKNEILENCLRAVKNKIDRLYPKDKPVATYFFRPRQGRGCTGHPSVEDHAVMADELTPFFKALLQ